MPDVITASEYLVINDYPFATPAARITSLVPLFRGPASRRGNDLVMNGANGRRPYARILDTTELVFAGTIWGDRDREGVAHSTPRAGLTLNLDEIHAEVLAIPATVAGTVEAEWHRADGATWTADVIVEDFTVRALSPRAVEFALTISIPAGWFVPPAGP